MATFRVADFPGRIPGSAEMSERQQLAVRRASQSSRVQQESNAGVRLPVTALSWQLMTECFEEDEIIRFDD